MLVLHLVRVKQEAWLITLGVCRHLDGVEASWSDDLLKKLVRRPGVL